MALTQPQIDLVQATVPVLKAQGHEITSHFYSILLSENPSLRNIFNLSNQKSGQQPFALASAVLAYAEHITHPGVLAGTVADINHKHASLGVTPEQYGVVGTYLLRSLEEVLGTETFNAEIKAAWLAAYQVLASMMIGQETSLYAESQRRKWDIAAVMDNSSPTIEHWRKCKVIEKVTEADGIVSLRFWPSGWNDQEPLPQYMPGQYISVRVDVPSEGYKQIRQYTLSDHPDSAVRKGYRITPKKIGTVSGILHSLKEGDEVDVSFPRGTFFYEPLPITSSTQEPLVFISAGVGLTPLMSILLSVLDPPNQNQASRQQLSWIHSTRSLTEYAFRDQLAAITSEHKDILQRRTFVTGSSDSEAKLGDDYDFQGRIDLSRLDRVHELHLDDERTVYFVSGPIDFMNSVGKELKNLGIAGDRIKAEIFGVGDIVF